MDIHVSAKGIIKVFENPFAALMYIQSCTRLGYSVHAYPMPR